VTESFPLLIRYCDAAGEAAGAAAAAADPSNLSLQQGFNARCVPLDDRRQSALTALDPEVTTRPAGRPQPGTSGRAITVIDPEFTASPSRGVQEKRGRTLKLSIETQVRVHMGNQSGLSKPKLASGPMPGRPDRGIIENKHSVDVVFRRTESARRYQHSP